VSDDVYRPLRRSDCDAVARYYNQNLAEVDPLWCAGGSEYDGNRIWLHGLVLAVRGRGRALGQVHERDGRVISYFGGYARGDRVTYSIGVVDPALPDPFETWRQDTVHLFQSALGSGARVFVIRASSDRARFVDWMEREVGMERWMGRNAWIAERDVIAAYVGALARAA
jgi:hypothetical protein